MPPSSTGRSRLQTSCAWGWRKKGSSWIQREMPLPAMSTNRVWHGNGLAWGWEVEVLVIHLWWGEWDALHWCPLLGHIFCANSSQISAWMRARLPAPLRHLLLRHGSRVPFGTSEVQKDTDPILHRLSPSPQEKMVRWKELTPYVPLEDHYLKFV